MNNCTFSGNVGQKPEKKSGKKADFIVFSVAVRQRGSDDPLWINCMCFQEGLMKVIEDYVTKGSMIVVAGELSVFEGDKGTRLQLNVNSLSLGGKRDDDDRKSSKSSSRSRDDDDDRRSSRRGRDDDDDRRDRRSRDRDDDRRDDDRKSSSKDRGRRDDDLNDEIPF